MGKNPSTTQELTDVIGQVHALLSACLASLLELVAEYDRREAWREDGATSMESWLVCRLGTARPNADDWVRVARALSDLPALRQTFSEGHLSWDQVRVVTKIATPETDDVLAGEAPARSVASLERLARRRRPTASHADTDRWLRMRWEPDESALPTGGAPMPSSSCAPGGEAPPRSSFTSTRMRWPRRSRGLRPTSKMDRR